jgi:Ca2+-binding RTX toxin-like protein
MLKLSGAASHFTDDQLIVEGTDAYIRDESSLHHVYTGVVESHTGSVVTASLIYGDSGDNRLVAGNADEVMVGMSGRDTIVGATGDDCVYSGSGDDSTSGGAGSDVLRGGTGGDVLSGGDGSDDLFGGGGRDTLAGGADGDIFVFAKGELNGDVVTDFVRHAAGGHDRLQFTGFDKGAQLSHLDHSAWQVSDHGHVETFTIEGVSTLTAADFSFV